MDRAEKLILGISLGTLLIFIFSIMYLSKGKGVEVPECIPAQQPFDQGELVELDEDTYQLKCVAKMWSFDPGTVRVPAGSEVDIYLSAADVVHGFWITHKNVNLMAVPGAVNNTTVEFDEPGTYDIICHEYCGSGHQQMRGKIIVEEPSDQPSKDVAHAIE